MRTVWAHPLNIEMRMADHGERVGAYSMRVNDGGALVMTVADDTQIIFESPMDVLSTLHEARHLIGDYILEHPEHFDFDDVEVGNE